MCARGPVWDRPLRGKWDRSCIRVGAGVLTRPQDRTGSFPHRQAPIFQPANFFPAQAPSGAGRDRTQALLILRAGTVLPASRGNPRKMGSGESGPMDLGGAKRSRSPSAASPVAFCLLFRHGKRRSPPAGGEISRAQRTQSEPCPLIRPFGPPIPIPFGLRPSPLDKGSRPPGGRQNERAAGKIPPKIYTSPLEFSHRR